MNGAVGLGIWIVHLRVPIQWEFLLCLGLLESATPACCPFVPHMKSLCFLRQISASVRTAWTTVTGTRPVTTPRARTSASAMTDSPAMESLAMVRSLEKNTSLQRKRGIVEDQWFTSCHPEPFHSQEWSISNFPCSLKRNITWHSMKNLVFHRLLRWNMIILPIITTSVIHFLFKGLGECSFWTFIRWFIVSFFLVTVNTWNFILIAKYARLSVTLHCWPYVLSAIVLLGYLFQSLPLKIALIIWRFVMTWRSAHWPRLYCLNFDFDHALPSVGMAQVFSLCTCRGKACSMNDGLSYCVISAALAFFNLNLEKMALCPWEANPFTPKFRECILPTF